MKRYLIILLLYCIGNIEVCAQVVSDRTNKITISNTQINTVLPEITWIYPRLEYTNSQVNEIELKATVVSDLKLKDVSIAVKSKPDGQPIAKKAIEINENGLESTIETSLFLNDGQNYIEIIAENIDGGIVKDFRSIIVGMDAISDAIAIDRKDYALLFATDKYDNWNDLVNPIYDAETIAAELEQLYGFEVEVVKNASQDKVFTKLREYAQKNFKPQDQLFIFFAGHGQYDDTFGEGYVVASNSLTSDPGKNTYISHNRLRSIINNISSSHIFLAMDVCFGGTFDEALASKRALSDDIDNTEFIVKKLSIPTRKYLTSGSKEYVSDGIPGKHSPFALRFLEALKSNGGEDRILTLVELNTYMQKLITTPRYGGFGNDEQGSEFLFIAR